MSAQKKLPSHLGSGELRFTRRRFTAAMAGAVVVSTTSFLQGKTNERRNSFAVSPNSYPGFADVTEFLDQVKKTPIRAVELPVGTDSPKCLIPE